MPKTLNNEYLRNMAGAPSGKRLLNNDYLKMIVEGGGGGGGSAPAGSYKAGGSITASGLTSSLLVAANEGKVYNLSDELTITSSNASLFTGVEAGQTYPAGTNVAVIDNNGSYRFDVMSGFVDLSDYAPLDSPELTGTPTAPTATLGTDTDQIATTAFVQQEIDDYTVPTMSPTVKGGAKLGTGLEVTDGTLSVNTVSSGDGSTAGPIVELAAKGHAEQATTTGKNLLNLSTFKNIVCDSLSISGDTVTIVGKKAYAKIVSTSLENLDVSTCMFSAEVVSVTRTTSQRMSIGFTIVNRSTNARRHPQTTFSSSGQYSIAAILASDEYISETYVAVNDTSSALDSQTTVVLKNLQIELGSTATAYEPYTGGAPSPSPDYAQEIRVCRGRNLLGKPYVTNTTSFSGVNWTYNQDGTILFSGTPTVSFNLILKGKDYTVFNDASNAVDIFDGAGDYVCSSGSSSVPILLNLYRNNSKVDTYTCSTGTVINVEDGDTAVVAAHFVQGVSVDTLVKPQLERGSVATPYVPYGYVGLEAQGKNLLVRFTNGDKKTVTSNGVTFTVNNDGSITANGKASGGNAVYYFMQTTDYAPTFFREHLGETVTISGCPNGGSTNTYWITLQGPVTGGIGVVDFGDSATTPIQNTSGIIQAYIGIKDGYTANNLTFYPQIEVGDKATEYEPYYHSTTPIPLPGRGWVAGLPDGTSDILTLNGAGKVTWEEKTNEVVLDGSSTWTQGGDGAGFLFLKSGSGSLNLNSVYGWDTNNSNFYSDKLRPVDNVAEWRSILSSGFIGSISKALNIHVPADIGTPSSWAEFLQSNPMTILYPLATPVTEEAGYVEMPEIPVGAELRIPELDDLGVKYCVDASASDLAMMWYDRARGEYADRLDGLDDDLVDTYGEIISANARIDTVSMDEDYDRQVLNGTYAGRNIQTILGTNSFDATISALHSRIASANFSGLRVGDFINVNCGAYGTVRFDIAHFDPYYQMGNTAMGHHIAFVAHTPIALPSGDAYGTGTNNTYLAWNTTNTNQGTEAENCPYLASHLHDWEINKLLPAMPTSLTNNLIDRWEYLETRYAAAGGLTASTSGAWKQLGKVWSLSEIINALPGTTATLNSLTALVQKAVISQPSGSVHHTKSPPSGLVKLIFEEKFFSICSIISWHL